MFDETLRLFKERVYVPMVLVVARTGVSPTQITLIGFVFGLLSALAASMGSFFVATTCWWIGRVLDGLDGSLARHTNQQSEFGGYVDILCDFCVYSLVPVGIVHAVKGATGEVAFYVLALLLGSYFVNAASLFMLSSLLEKRQTTRKNLTSVIMPRGLVEGVETMVAYQLFLLFPTHCVFLMSLFCGLVVVTILMRLVWAFHNLN
jgi:phosphatidylglycerophosphate synthase